MSHILDVLIATHPKPEEIKELLQQSRPGLVDELIDGREKPKYRETILEEFQLRLRHYDGVIDTAVKFR
jgi:type III secretory pathway lipoprotein EscJ